MDLFELAAKISVDDSNFKKSMENAQKVSKNVATAIQQLQSPLDKAKSGFNAIAHPVETAKANIEKLKSATEAIRHPIETFKNKVADASTALETKRNKLSTLAAGYDSAKKKVADITKEFNKSAKESGTSSQKTQELAKKLNEAEKEAEEAKRELDDYSKSVSKAGKNSDAASNGVGNFASKLGKGLATAGKVAGAALGVAAAGVTALTTAAINSYAEYEQLAGGAQKIFDQMDYSKIATDANNAYKDLGMSASQYLAVINDVGASFAATMGDEAGYDAAKKGLTAISDYASGTGKDFNELQQKLAMITRSTSSYQSIADQFSGILPATSEGFLKQAQAAGVLSTKYKKLTDVPIQEYQKAVTDMLALGVDSLGLTGNTAAEAATTIEGSLNMMKAAWQNLVVGMGDSEADMDTLISNFAESTKTAAKNILPKISQALSGIGEVITALSPVIAEALPQLVEEVLPSLLEAAVSLVAALINGIIAALPALGTALLEAVQLLLTDVFGVSEESAGQFAEGVTGAFKAISDGFTALVEAAQTEGTWLNEIWTGLQETGQLFSDFLVALWDAISSAFTWCVEQINTEGTLLNTIWTNIQTVISAAVEIINGIISAFTAVLKGDWSAAWEAVKSIASTAFDAVCSVIGSIVEWITGFLGTMVEKGTELIGSLAEGIQNKFAELFTLVGGWVTDNIVDPIADKAGDILNKGKEIIDKLKEGMKEAWEGLKSWFTGVWDALFNRKTTVTKNEDGSVSMKPYATGLDYVPYDEFPALLHRGEAVLTAAEAKRWRKYGLGGGAVPAMAGGVTINQYIQSVPQTPVELASATEAYFEQARWML